MRKARLHWFWRAAIAMILGCAYSALSTTTTRGWHRSVAAAIEEMLGGDPGVRWGWESGVAATIAWFAPVLLIAFSVYGLLTWWLGPRGSLDGETRCRKCGYILRGITEPRCPECGERI